MGESAFYSVDGVEVYTLRNRFAAFPYAMEVFSFADWVDEARGVALGEGFPRPEEEEGFLGFRTTCGTARKRLDVQGYTLEKSFEAFKRSAQELEGYLEEYTECDDADEYDDEPEHEGLYLNNYAVDVKVEDVIPILTQPQAVLNAYRQVFTEEAMRSDMWTRREVLREKPVKGVNAFADALIKTSPQSLLGVIPFVDINPLYELRVILEVVSDVAIVEYDCEMVLRYWDSDIELYLKEHLETGPLSESSKTIILTEGVTDDEFLRGSLEVLAPDVAHCFRFFEYHAELNPERSAEALKKLASAFVAVGLSERFMFLFDNDAVGSKCRDEIKDSLLQNMTAICLPDAEVAKAYPTYGPQGFMTSDVNGRAVSIEFFLGQDSLTASDGKLRPVRWGQQVNGVYQASFSKEDKNAIQASFRSALAMAKAEGVAEVSHDWRGMLSLLDYVFECSSSLPPVTHDSLLLHV